MKSLMGVILALAKFHLITYLLHFFFTGTQVVLKVAINNDIETAKVGAKGLLLTAESSHLFTFSSTKGFGDISDSAEKYCSYYSGHTTY